jgi:hypothetical protein
MFGKRDLYEEPPKGVCADNTEIHVKYSAKSGDMQNGCVPALSSTMHVNIRAECPPLHYIRPLEVTVFHLTPFMHSHGVGC